jgi:4-amino-4-deoxy-L-arabinose transferase-like glycosyltransferase
MQNINLGRLVLISIALLSAWLGQGMLLASTALTIGGALMLGLGAAVFLALAFSAHAESTGRPAPAGIGALLARVDALPLGYALMGLSLVAGGAAFWLATQPETDTWAALLAWGAAILVFGVSALALDRTARVAAPTSALRFARWEWGALLGITLAALALRAWNIAQIPINFGGDEGEMGWVARDILTGNEYARPFATGWLSHPMLWFYLQAASLRLFGNDIFGLRILSALIGAATIPALYLFARPIYGRSVALLATSLLAFYHFHIHYSRIALNNIADPFMALVAFGAFVYGYRRRSLLGFALAGASLGVAQHFYMGSRLTPLILLGVLAHQLIFDRSHLLGLWRHLIVAAIGFVLGLGPLLHFFITHPADYNARLVNTSIIHSGWLAQKIAEGQSAVEVIGDQMRLGFGAFTFVPERSSFYDTGIPLLDQTSGTLMMLGLALAAAQFRRQENALLLGWIVGTAVLGGVMMISLSSPRYVTAAPALCLLIALALQQLGQLLAWTLRLPDRAVYGVLGACVLALAVWNVNFYFREYTPRANYGGANTEASSVIASYLRGRSAGTYAYLFGPPQLFFGNGVIRFAAPNTPGEDVNEPVTSPADLPQPPEGMSPVFIFIPDRLAELEVVRQRYPEGEVRSYRGRDYGDPLITIYQPR